MGEKLKVKPPLDYPPEEGGYRVDKISFLRGNDYSPVAVVVILNTFDFAIPAKLEEIIKRSIEKGAALAGMLQTENIGIEKIIANIIANPNIRYIILCGRESLGHLQGQALLALINNGVDDRRKILGAEAPTPFLYNISMEMIERFRKQIVLINLLNIFDPEIVESAVWACCQERPTKFMDHILHDPGAYPEPPICSKITWRITQPWTVMEEKDRQIVERIREAVKRREEKPRVSITTEGKIKIKLKPEEARREEAMAKAEVKLLKVKPPVDYPPEEGHYIRGNDYSPVAVVVLLNAPYEKIPSEIERVARISIETGAALAGTLQTANIGLEKMITNIVANPNIRYLVLCGKEVEGHKVGGALIALMKNGIDNRRIIIGTTAPTAYLFNIPLEAIERFRKQVTLINLIDVLNLEIIRKAVWSCYQEKPNEFMGYTLYDIGAYPESPMCCKITWRIKKPETIEEWEIDEEFIKKL